MEDRGHKRLSTEGFAVAAVAYMKGREKAKVVYEFG
jgi:hypothetical protein